MKQLRFLFLIYLMGWFSISICAQQLTVEAPSSVDQNEYFHLRFKVNSASASGFTPPALTDFEILSGPVTSTSSSFQMMNGKTSRSESTTYTYILSPRQKGTFTIGAATISVGGKTLRSAPATIRVGGNGAKQSAAQASPQNAQPTQPDMQTAGSRVTESDLYITLTPSRTKVYEQEAVLLTYNVHARNGVGLSNVMLANKPDFKGIVSQEIPIKSIQTHTEGGYRVGTILQYVIFPQDVGNVQIPSITFNCSVAQRHQFDDPFDAFFNGGGMVGVQVERTVKSTQIEVKALPTKPTNFSGGVGQFTMQGELVNQPKTNDIATYRIIISGRGNLKMLSAPQVAFPQDFDTYDAKTTDQTDVTRDGLSGKMIFEYTFVPRNVGKYEIPAVEFVFFNPSTGAYETLRTEPVHLDVQQGERSKADVDEELALRGSDIRPQKKGEAKPYDLSSPFFWGSAAYWATLLLILLAATVAVYFLRRQIKSRADFVGTKRRKAGRVAAKRLKRAGQLLKSSASDEFYDEVAHALQGYLADKFNMPVSEMSKERIRSLMEERQVPESVAAEFFQAFDACEFARFAPSQEAGERKKIYETAIKAIDDMEKKPSGTTKSKTEKSVGTTSPQSLLLLLMFTFSFAFSSLSAQTADNLEKHDEQTSAVSTERLKREADSCFAAKNYIGAQQRYEQILSLMVAPEIYYNLGNAFYRQNNLSKAILNYERALRLNPTDADIQHNLALARTKITDRLSAPPKMFFVKWWTDLQQILSSDDWAWMAVLMLVLALLATGLYLFTDRIALRKTGFFSTILFVLCFLCFNFFAWKQSSRFFSDRRAVIMSDAPLYPNSAGTNGKVVELHEGTTVTILDSARSRYNVVLPDERTGWMEAKTVEKVW